jgi:hypothetical protein
LGSSCGWRGDAYPKIPASGRQNPAALKINGPALTFAHCWNHARSPQEKRRLATRSAALAPPKRGFHRTPMAGFADADAPAVFAAGVSLAGASLRSSANR